VADNKRFYWIKLKTDFFNIDKIDYIISRPNGCQYIVLYQMLCLMTANNNGKLCSTMGEIIVPYDIDKIVRETKYFDFDTVAMALNLFIGVFCTLCSAKACCTIVLSINARVLLEKF